MKQINTRVTDELKHKVRMKSVKTNISINDFITKKLEEWVK